jgi:hypothetical protein
MKPLNAFLATFSGASRLVKPHLARSLNLQLTSLHFTYSLTHSLNQRPINAIKYSPTTEQEPVISLTISALYEEGVNQL